MENLKLLTIAWVYQKFYSYPTYFIPFSNIILFLIISIMFKYFLKKYELYCITA